MCPGTLAIAAAGMMAGQQLLGGVMKAEAADFGAQVARNNYITSQQNAHHAAAAASSNVEKAGLQARAKNSGVRASLAAGGLDINSGSAADIQDSQRRLGALDVATTANNAAREVYGYQTQAMNYKAQQKIDNAEIVPDLLGGVLGAGAAIAGSAAATSAIFGDGAGAAGGAASGAQSFAPGATGMPQSLISSAPSVPSNYTWMMNSSQEAIY